MVLGRAHLMSRILFRAVVFIKSNTLVFAMCRRYLNFDKMKIMSDPSYQRYVVNVDYNFNFGSLFLLLLSAMCS